MTEHNPLRIDPYASFTNAQLPLLKVAARYFDKLVILDPVRARWGTIGADHHARECLNLCEARPADSEGKDAVRNLYPQDAPGGAAGFIGAYW